MQSEFARLAPCNSAPGAFAPAAVHPPNAVATTNLQIRSRHSRQLGLDALLLRQYLSNLTRLTSVGFLRSLSG